MDYEKTAKKGTTTVGLLCSDGVILASEKRATMGNLIANKDAQKVLPIDDKIGITIAGQVGDAQALQRIMKAQLSLYKIQRRRDMAVEAAGSLLANILQETKYFPYFIQLVLGGYDTKPRLYSLDMAGSLMEEVYTSSGSGSPTAFGVLEARFKPGKSIEENIPIAAVAIKTAMERDSYSGNGVNMAVIDKNGFRKIDEKDLEKYIK